MDDAWKASLRDGFGQTFDRFERALQDCPDALWEATLWPSTQAMPAGTVLGADRPGAERGHMLSAFWFVAWHALDCTHYDIEGLPFPEWAPPPPFSVAGTDCALDLSTYLPLRVFTRSELLEYVVDARRKADATVKGLTDERTARPVPHGHRYAGMPYASLLLMCLTHVGEHRAQLEMFLGQRAVVRT